MSYHLYEHHGKDSGITIEEKDAKTMVEVIALFKEAIDRDGEYVCLEWLKDLPEEKILQEGGNTEWVSE